MTKTLTSCSNYVTRITNRVHTTFYTTTYTTHTTACATRRTSIIIIAALSLLLMLTACSPDGAEKMLPRDGNEPFILEGDGAKGILLLHGLLPLLGKSGVLPNT